MSVGKLSTSRAALLRLDRVNGVHLDSGVIVLLGYWVIGFTGLAGVNFVSWVNWVTWVTSGQAVTLAFWSSTVGDAYNDSESSGAQVLPRALL